MGLKLGLQYKQKVPLCEFSKGSQPYWGCLFTWKLWISGNLLSNQSRTYCVSHNVVSRCPLSQGLPLVLPLGSEETMRSLLMDVLTYRKTTFSWQINRGQSDSISVSSVARAWNRSMDKNQPLTSQHLFFLIGYQLPNFLAGNSALHILQSHMWAEWIWCLLLGVEEVMRAIREFIYLARM